MAKERLALELLDERGQPTKRRDIGIIDLAEITTEDDLGSRRDAGENHLQGCVLGSAPRR